MSKIGYFPGKNNNNNIISFIQKHTHDNPDRSIFRWNEGQEIKEISFTEFLSDVRQLASGLREIHINEGDRCIVFLPVTITMYKVLAALQYNGAIPVFFDSWTRKLHLQSSIEQIQPKGIVSFNRAYEYFAQIPKINEIEIKIIDTDLPHSTTPIEIAALEQESTGLITFTTGSSGVPKAANRTHRFLAAQHYALSRYIKYSQNDIDLTSFPVFSLNAIASGVTTVIPSIDIGAPKDTDGEVLTKQILKNQVTCLTISPSLFNEIAAYCKRKALTLDSLKTVITGGAPISIAELKEFRDVSPAADIQVLYGSTEVEPIAHLSLWELNAASTVDFTESSNGICTGKIDDELRYKVIQLDGNYEQIKSEEDWKKYQLNLNEIGELLVSGEHVCNSYYNNDSASSKSKIVDYRGIVWHRTGDVVRVDKNQMVWLFGRVHNVIKRQNKYLYPVPVEAELKKLAFIRHVAYLGIPDTALGQAAYVVVEPNQTIEGNVEQWTQEIIKVMQEHNLDYDRILFRNEIPLDPRHHSKVEYNSLRNQLLSQ